MSQPALTRIHRTIIEPKRDGQVCPDCNLRRTDREFEIRGIQLPCEAREEKGMRGKLTLNDAIRIRVAYRRGTTVSELAEEYAVTPTAIRSILQRKTHSVSSITNKLKSMGFKSNQGRKIGGWL